MLEEQSQIIQDIDASSFINKVIEESKKNPVIVDFWATWCNPCKQLTPILEKVVLQMNGKVKLVKVDIDLNQSLAQQMQIQSVPTVLAFFEGKPVNGFAGMKSEEEVLNFITEVTTLSGHSSEGLKNISSLLDEAEKKLQEKDYEAAIYEFSSLLGNETPSYFENIILPVGISFYIFQKKPYLIELNHQKHPTLQKIHHLYYRKILCLV